jgi:hypothetical protein
VSLLNRKIAGKSVDKLLHYVGRLGIQTEAKFRQISRPEVDSEFVYS